MLPLISSEYVYQKKPQQGLKAKGKPKPKTPNDSQPVAYWYSEKQEAEVSTNVGGKQTRASGRGSEKADVRVKGKLRVECKATAKASYAIGLTTWRKVEQHCLGHGESPAMSLHFLDAQGSPVAKLLVLDEETWLPVIKHLLEMQEG